MTTFTEARLIMECKKLYYQDLEPGRFIQESIHKNYPNKDYHRMYIGELLTLQDKVEENHGE